MEVARIGAAPIDHAEIADLDEKLKATVLSEGIRAVAFIPLVSDGALIGKFMAYFRAPYAFTKEDVAVSLVIARQLAIAIQRNAPMPEIGRNLPKSSMRRGCCRVSASRWRTKWMSKCCTPNSRRGKDDHAFGLREHAAVLSASRRTGRAQTDRPLRLQRAGSEILDLGARGFSGAPVAVSPRANVSSPRTWKTPGSGGYRRSGELSRKQEFAPLKRLRCCRAVANSSE